MRKINYQSNKRKQLQWLMDNLDKIEMVGIYPVDFGAPTLFISLDSDLEIDEDLFDYHGGENVSIEFIVD